MILMIVGSWIVAVSSDSAISIPLLAISNKGNVLSKTTLQTAGKLALLWISNRDAEPLIFKSGSPAPFPPDESLNLAVSCLDQGYGKLGVKLTAPGKTPIPPDRFLGLSRSNSGKMVTARMSFADVPPGVPENWSFMITMEGSTGEALAIENSDAWGRFITNEDKPSDWWLELTRMGNEMIAGKRNPYAPLPESPLRTKDSLPNLNNLPSSPNQSDDKNTHSH
jgi:hypothetical protein